MNIFRYIFLSQFLSKVNSFALFLSMVCYASANVAPKPQFLKVGLQPLPQAEVLDVIDHSSASVVFLNGGLEVGLDIGMTASIYQNAQNIGTLILVASNIQHSAAMILELKEGKVVQVGDGVRLNTTQEI